MLGGMKVGEGSGTAQGLQRKLLSFEYLGSLSVNNFEVFGECDEVY